MLHRSRRRKILYVQSKENEARLASFRSFMITLFIVFMIVLGGGSWFFYTPGQMNYFYTSLAGAIVCLIAACMFIFLK